MERTLYLSAASAASAYPGTREMDAPLSVSSHCCTRDRGGSHYGLVHKSPLGRDTSTTYVYSPKQITSDFRVVQRGKEIHFCHVPPRRAETFVNCSGGHLAQQ